MKTEDLVCLIYASIFALIGVSGLWALWVIANALTKIADKL